MRDNKKIPLISVVGPTASGKTHLGVFLAKQLGGEVVSADSMQIYKGMDIASAKPTTDEMDTVPHHLIGFLDPKESFSVASYVEAAKAAAEDIHSRGKIPVLVGGTGLYVDSFLNNIAFAENDSDENLRAKLKEQAEMYGTQYLSDMLRSFDSESADRIEPNNIKRIIRAIEIYKTTGITMTEHIKRSKLYPSPYNAVKIGLKAQNRQYLYNRIEKRVDVMVESGLLKEAEEALKSDFGKTAQKAIGIKELKPYFDGECTLEQALSELKKQTRRYAKRQLTWFLRDKEIRWFDIDTYKNTESLEKDVLDYTQKALEEC